MTTSVPLIIDTVQQSSVYLCMRQSWPLCVYGQSLVSIWFHSVHCVQCIWPTWSHHGHCSSVWVQILSGSELWIQKEQKEPLKFETKLCKIWPRIFFNKTTSDCFSITSKFIEMGGLVHFFLSLVFRSSISALSWHSFIPPILLILN